MTVPRPLPEVTGENEYFWRGGAEGRLQILRCGSCGRWIHPPSPICRHCHARDLAPQPVSGRGTVRAFTINRHRWRADMEVPFVIASIELAEEAGLFVTSNVVGCGVGEVQAGMAVEVSFRNVEDVWLPLFTPAASGCPSGGVASP